jgi:NAD(P)-dependent dehydrogenase (short-subunit alcohol dehydrogenase family)
MLNEMFSLKGKDALVTGGAQGLGRMMAEALLQVGARVTITSRKTEVAERAVAEMSSLGECRAITCDLASVEGAEYLAETYGSDSRGLDILINNAGKSWGAPIEDFPDKAWSGVMTVNVQIPFKLVQLFLPLLSAPRPADDPARIINIGSVAGLRTENLSAYSYVASKAAIHQLTKELAATFAGCGINVNAIVPGYFATSMTAHLRDEDGATTEEIARHIPLGRFGRPAEIGATAIFLAGRGGAYITGALIPVDGGLSGCR